MCKQINYKFHSWNLFLYEMVIWQVRHGTSAGKPQNITSGVLTSLLSSSCYFNNDLHNCDHSSLGPSGKHETA